MQGSFKQSFISRLKHLKSLRMVIILVVLIVSILPMLLVDRMVISGYKSKAMDDLMINIQAQCSLLAADILSYSYFDNTNSEAINSELEQMAYTYSARIIIVNSDFCIINDTYNYDEGKILISDSVLTAFRGKINSNYDKKTGSAEITIPINDSSNDNIVGAIAINASDDSIKNMTDYLNQIITAVSAGMIILSFIFAVILANFIVRPLNKLSKSIVKISNGVKEGHVEPRSLYEYNEVSDSVNIMLDRIRILDDSRQEFVSNVSHELKTPMTSVKVLADSLLAEEDASIEVYREFMQDIVNEIDRENQIIGDLLTLVKMDQSSADLNIATVNVNELIELILKRLRPIAINKNVELVFESFRPVAAEIDEVKFTLAVTNLVENAIKYNVQDGWVRVSLNADHKYFYVKVADSGIGIPNDCKDHIFERFYRVDKARSRETGGTGLGLAITKNVVMMHKGVIKLYSKENEGTTFTVRMPLYHVMSGGDI